MHILNPNSTTSTWTVTAVGLATALILGRYFYRSSKDAKRSLFRRYTAIDDLSVLGRERKGAKLKGKVVIAGGSMAGLFTALACVPQCEEVVIIEPDEGATEECTVGTRQGPHGFKVHTSTRKRIMQTFGFHIYQPFILLALNRWFSDFEDHVLALGGMIKPWDVSLHLSGIVYGDPAYIQPEARCLPKHPNIPSGKVPHSLYLSRVLFEPLLRRLVKKRYPDVIFIKGTVMAVVLDATKKRVTGIEYTSEKGERVSLECALFVDCAGMARMGIKWLQKAGVSPPKVITYNANMRYGFIYLPIPPSVKYKLPIPGGIKDCQPIFYTNAPLSIYDQRAIYAVKLEDDMVVIAVGGWDLPTEALPHSPEEIKAYVNEIKQAPGLSIVEWFHEFLDLMLQDDNWQNVVYDEFLVPENALVEYHKSQSLPDNFLAIGDSACVTNPAYGWGVNRAGVTAVTLAGALDSLKGTEIPQGFATRFFRAVELRTAWAWQASRSMDYAYPGTTPCEGETLDKFKFDKAFGWRIIKVCSTDPEAGSRLYYGRMWLWPPSVAVSRWTLLKVLWYRLTVE